MNRTLLITLKAKRIPAQTITKFLDQNAHLAGNLKISQASAEERGFFEHFVPVSINAGRSWASQ
jgi:hypothetical protein